MINSIGLHYRFSFFIILILSVIFIYNDINISTKSNDQIPAPTEFSIKKKNRKIHKENRKKYFEMMHKAPSDIDWKKVNHSYREERAKELTLTRSNYNPDTIKDNLESFLDRDLEGFWEERGSNNLAGRVHTIDVDFDAGIIYCGSSGGNIWIGSINGEGWVCANDYMQIDNINMLRAVQNQSTRQNRLLISGGNKFYYSDNEGFTINQSSGLNGVESWGEIYRSIVTYNDTNTNPVIFVLTKEWDSGSTIKIFRSDNIGESFYEIYSTPLESEKAYDIWTDRYELSDVYFLNNGNLFSISIDDNSINYIANAGPQNQGENIISGGKDLQNNDQYHFHAKIGTRSYFSNNDGIFWLDKGELPSYTFFRNSYSCSYDNMNLVTIGGIDLYKSLNAGTNWEKVNDWWEYYENPEIYLHADIPEVQFLKNNNGDEITYISTDGGLYNSSDQLINVNNQSLSGLGISQYYSTYTKKFTPYQIFAGSQDQGFQRSVNQLYDIYDFEQVISGDYGHLVSGDNGVSIWSVYPGFAMYYPNASTNINGITWDFDMTGHLWMPPLMEDPNDPSSVYIAGGGLAGGNHIIKLTRSGSTIDVSESDFNFNNTVTALAYSPIDPSHRYALTYNGTFYYSEDSGINWTASPGFSGPDSHYFYGSKILPSKIDLGKVIIAGSGYSNPPVFVTFNHGNSFSNMGQGMPSTLVYDLASTENENFIFAATAVGAFAFSEDQQLWEDIIGLNGTDQTYWSVEYVPELLTARFGTYGRGIWDFILYENFEILVGDLNQDTIINIQDIIILINISLAEIMPSEYQNLAGDINQDETIDILDIINCINIILNR